MMLGPALPHTVLSPFLTTRFRTTETNDDHNNRRAKRFPATFKNVLRRRDANYPSRVGYPPSAQCRQAGYEHPHDLYGIGWDQLGHRPRQSQIGRASCRERVEISVVAVSLKKRKMN